jgi:hypothetical protein
MANSSSDDRNLMTADKARRYLDAILARGHKRATAIEMQMVVEFAVNPRISYLELIAKYRSLHNKTAEEVTKMYHDFLRYKFKHSIAIAHNLPLEEVNKWKIPKHSIGEVLNRYKVPHPHPMRGEMLKLEISEIPKYCQERLPKIQTEADREKFIEGINDLVQKVVEGIDAIYELQPDNGESGG